MTTMTTRSPNVVAVNTFSPITKSLTFSSWLEAAAYGGYSHSAWRYKGRNIQKKHRPFPFGYVEVDDKLRRVFREDQTSQQTEPTRSKNILAGMFVPWHEMVGYRDRDTGDIRQVERYRLNKPIRELVYKQFDHQKSVHGTLVPLWGKDDVWADDFYVRAGERSSWFVIDLDNHRPTLGSTEAHLRLVRHLVQTMPLLMRQLGGGSVFYDYRQDAPQGIHAWVTLRHARSTKHLHETVRFLLEKYADPSLDRDLKSHGLKAMGDLEILPTENCLIRLFGSPGRKVFTTRELAPKGGQFDAESLVAHIQSNDTTSDPTARYSDLARLAVGGTPHDDSPTMVAVDPSLRSVAPEPAKKAEYFSWLVSVCLNGVAQEDVLYAAYLVPLAQALYFREFRGQLDRARLTESAILRWLHAKHNGRVTRIKDGKWPQLKADVRRIVRHMDDTPEAIQNYWAKVRNKDAQHPDKRISLVRCMDASLSTPLTVTKNNVDAVRGMLGGVESGEETKGNICNGCITPPHHPLPSTVETRLRDHLLRVGVRKGTCTERIVQFATSLLNEVGTKGVRRIGTLRINEMAALGKGRRHAHRYKKILVGAGILFQGWDKAVRVKKAVSEYRLTAWALEEMRKSGFSSPTEVNTPTRPRSAPTHDPSTTCCSRQEGPCSPLPYRAARRPIDLSAPTVEVLRDKNQGSGCPPWPAVLTEMKKPLFHPPPKLSKVDTAPDSFNFTQTPVLHVQDSLTILTSTPSS